MLIESSPLLTIQRRNVILLAYTVCTLTSVRFVLIGIDNAGTHVHSVRVDDTSEIPARPRSAIDVNVLEQHAL